MKFIEESYARELHCDLMSVFTQAAHRADVTLQGAGVHWNCIVKQGDRQCCIHCFDVKRPEYLTSFDESAETRATGRTFSKADTIAAARLWIESGDMAQLHERFQFVDQQKRSLSTIANAIIACCPELNHVRQNLQHLTCDLYELWFRERDRSCRISYYGKNLNPDAVFHWDGCRNFAVQTGDSIQLALILKRWLCDHLMPSELQKEFPAIEMGKVARYYEEGRGVEGEFVESWDRIETFYKEMNFPPAEEVRALIKAMRESGYDRTLRAGQSMYTLVLSRSRRHGLRTGQISVSFCFREREMEIIPQGLGLATITVPEIILTKAVEAVLKQLQIITID